MERCDRMAVEECVLLSLSLLCSPAFSIMDPPCPSCVMEPHKIHTPTHTLAKHRRRSLSIHHRSTPAKPQ